MLRVLVLAAAAAAQTPPPPPRRPNATAASRAAWKAACLPKVQQPSPKPKRVAISLWGEAFRDSRKRGERRSCGIRGLHSQNATRALHFELFDKLESFGYETFVVGATTHCEVLEEVAPLQQLSSRAWDDGVKVLSKWYASKLALPIAVRDGVLGADFESSSTPIAATRSGTTTASMAPSPRPPRRRVLTQVHPVRLLNGALKSRLASLALLQKINVKYSHVLSLRWDLRVAPEHVEMCWFESRRIFDSHVLGNFSLDWDRAELVPFEYAAAWTCLLDEDEPWLEARSTPSSNGWTEGCAPDGGTTAAALYDAPTKCVCGDPGFVGFDPPGECWNRHCAWDVCLNAFPSEARRSSCRSAPAFGAKLHRAHGGGTWEGALLGA